MSDCSLTCLGEQTSSGLSCHVLDICNTRLLLECPLDASLSLHFLPADFPTRRLNGQLAPGRVDGVQNIEKQAGSGEDQPLGGTSCSFEDTSLPHCKRLQGQVLIDEEPWYKLADIGTLDWSSIDAVLISNPRSMLGLPYLMQEPSFLAKVYVTEAAGKLGKLLMEELLAMHESYLAQFGNSQTPRPSWLEQGMSKASGTQGLLNNRVWDAANWHPMYSAGDLNLCMKRLSLLRYGEVTSIEGSVEIKPVSSGLGLGAANWSIVGSGMKLSYVSGSLMLENHSRSFDAGSLSGCDYLLVSEVESKIEGEVCSETVGGVNLEGMTSGYGTKKDQPNLSAVNKSTALTSLGVKNKVSPGSSARHVFSTSVVPRKSRSCESVSPPVPTVKCSIHGSSENGAPADQKHFLSEWKSSLTAIGKAASEAAVQGGSVLIPVSPTGAMLELIEELANALALTGASAVPIFYISPSAGELLSYTNTIPEWLSTSRSEKLYAGEALFSHVDLLQDKRLQHFCSLTSLELQRSWQEPCIVLASHWTMRMGPAVHLLYRWSQNPLSLLIAVEPNVDLQLALAPFMPMEMKAVYLPLPTCLRPRDVASVLKSVQTNFVLIPAVARERMESLVTSAQNVHYYDTGSRIQLGNHGQDIRVDLFSTQAGQGLASDNKTGRPCATRVRGELTFKDATWRLSALPSATKYQCRWGTLNLEKLLAGLKDRGLHCIYMKDEVSVGLDGIRMTSREKSSILKRSVVEVVSPFEGRIEIGSKGTTISVNDALGRLLITQAVASALEE